MLRRILIGDNERVLVIRKRRFAEILEPGERWITLAQEIELGRYNVRDLVYAGECSIPHFHAPPYFTRRAGPRRGLA